MTFESQIINGDKYRKWKKLREYLFIIWIFLGFPLWHGMAFVVDEDWVDNYSSAPLGLKIYITIILLSVLSYKFFTEFSKEYDVKGELLIKEESIEVSIDDNHRFWTFEQTKMVEVIRNTEYHKTGSEESTDFPGNNFIRIVEASGAEQRFEFLIRDKSHDNDFQRMIDKFLFNRVRGRVFLSI